jgi:LPXTG-motif cell wall-anchored protein
MARVGPFLKPPYLYGVIGIVGIAGGGIVFYLRRRE